MAGGYDVCSQLWVCREDWSATSDTVTMTAATISIRSVCAGVRLSTVIVVTDIEEVVAPQPARVGKDRRQLPSWRWEELRTTLWVVPSIFVVVSVLLFIVTFEIDVAAYHGHLTLPYWIRTGNADAERQVLIAIAAAVITVIGVVFSITILALTLASQQFGPRMMRNFVRDIGNQVTLGDLRRHVRLLRARPGFDQQR